METLIVGLIMVFIGGLILGYEIGKKVGYKDGMFDSKPFA